MFKKIFDPYRELSGKRVEVKKEVRKPKESFLKNIFNNKKKVKKTTRKKINVKKDKADIKLSKRSVSTKFLKVFYLILKDLKLVIRSKTSGLIVLLGPLLIILLVGLAFNTSSMYNLKVASYSEGYSTLTESVIKELDDEEYDVYKISTKEECMEGVRLGEYHVCIIFPKDMVIGEDVENIVTFYVDESRVNIASLISNSVNKKISAKVRELSTELTSGLAGSVEVTKEEIGKQKPGVDKLYLNNIEMRTNLGEAKDNLAMMNFSSGDLNTTEMMNELEKAEENGVTGISDLKKAIKRFDSNLDDIEIRLLDAEISHGELTEKITEFSNTLEADFEALRNLKQSVDAINMGLEGVKTTDVGSIVSPIKTNIEPISSKKTHLSFLFPTLVMLVLMFISLLLASTIVIREKESSAYFRNFITPTGDFLYLISAYLANIILIIIQIAVLFGVAFIFFKGTLVQILLNSSLILILMASVFILIGMFIGYLFNNEETATLGAVAVGSIMLFFSNTILPIETLPMYIRNILRFNPYVLGSSMLKKVLLFNTNLIHMLEPIYIAMGFVIGFLILGYMARVVTKRFM